jgi:hypothetical protein
MTRTESTPQISFAAIFAAAYVFVCTAVPVVHLSPAVPAAARLGGPEQAFSISRLFKISAGERAKQPRVDPVKGAGLLAFALGAVAFALAVSSFGKTSVQSPEAIAKSRIANGALIPRFLAAS